MTGENVKRLARGLFGKQEIPDYDIPFTGTVLPLAEMIKALLKLPESAFGLYAWTADPLDGRFSISQKCGYIARAMQCGREEARLIKKKYGTADPDELAALMGLKISEPKLPVGGGRVVFAQYTEPDEVTIFTDAVEKAEALMQEENLGPLLENTDIRRLLLAHELFHRVEYNKRATIYTKTEKVELWKKPFSNQSGLICLGELAGMAFAGELLEMSCSPYIFDVVLMYGYNQEAAAALFEVMTELAAAAKADGGDKC